MPFSNRKQFEHFNYEKINANTFLFKKSNPVFCGDFLKFIIFGTNVLKKILYIHSCQKIHYLI